MQRLTLAFWDFVKFKELHNLVLYRHYIITYNAYMATRLISTLASCNIYYFTLMSQKVNVMNIVK